MKTFMILIALMLFALPVLAETYVWEDDQGTVNFADDLGKVPKKYRKKAKIVGEEEPPPQEKGEGKEPPAAERKTTSEKGQVNKAAAAAEEQRGKNDPAARQREEEGKGATPRENKGNVPAAQ